jgi:predicted permease
MRSSTLLADLLRDVRYGARVLLRSPVFAAVAILSLALGIGGAASVFAVLNAVMLRSLPVPDPQRLFAAEISRPQNPSARFSWPLFEQARDELKGKAELFAMSGVLGVQFRRTGAGSPPPRRAIAQLVSGEYFQAIGQAPQLGRNLTPDDNRTVGERAVAVISDGFWEREFARAPSAVGSEILINGAGFTVVGVAGPSFFGVTVALRNPDIWIPLMMQPVIRYASNASNSGGDPQQPWPPQPQIAWLNVLARVAHGVNPDVVATTMTVLHRREALTLEDAADEEDRQRIQQERVTVAPAARGLSFLRTSLSTPLFVLLALVGVLLAIASGNLASLLIARASARDREIAIRLSIGAGRARIVRQLLTETLLLAAIGGYLGLLVAAWGRDLLLSLFAAGSARIDLDTSFDWRVLGFSTAVTILTGIASGVVPALRGTRVPINETLKLGARTAGADPRRLLVGKSLVVAQIAFSLLLLVLAGLFARSLRSVLETEIGFDRHVVTAQLDVRSMGLTTGQQQELYRRIIDRMRVIPGVASVSLSLDGPLGNSYRASSLGVEGYEPREDEQLVTGENVVTDQYFATVGLRLLEGRLFGPEDRTPGRRSTVINETMARRFFPGGSAVGKRWSYGEPIGPDSHTIIGVVEDAKYLELRPTPPNMAYHLTDAMPVQVLGSLEVRPTDPTHAMGPTIQRVLNEAEPALPVFDVARLDERVSRHSSNDRMVAWITAMVSGLALLLVALGLYGMIAYGVTRRTPELGVRMALGGTRGHVLWLVLREALALVVVGSAIGLPLAIGAARAARSMLVVQPFDPLSYSGAAIALLLVAGAGAFLPAYRASRIDPMAALRSD